MKKDIKWLKAEVLGLRSYGNVETNQTAIEREIGRLQKWAWNNCVDRVYELIDQLDEPEVLSQPLGNSQELPIIPKFVAEFLIGKEDYMLYELFDDEWLYKEHDRVAKWLYDNDGLTNKQREIDLVMACDRGFTVEEEQKYYALVKGNENIYSDDKYWNYCVTDNSLSIGDNKVHPDVSDDYVLKFTQDQWGNLGINDTNADFEEVVGE